MPPMNKKAVEQVSRYRQKGLGVREIARLMKKDPTQVLRWLKYGVDSYPQQGVDNK